MGAYLSPPVPSDYETKCAIIMYPSDGGFFYLQAVRGALSELAKWYKWEGENAREIADIFLEHDILTDGTFFALDCDDVPFVVGREDVNINVNTSGGCCQDITWGIPDSPQVNGLQYEEYDDNATGDVTSMTEQERCDLATYMVQSHIGIWDKLDGWFAAVAGGIDALYLYLEQNLNWAVSSTARVSQLVLVQLGMAVGTAIPEWIIERNQDAWQQYRDDFICIIRDSVSPDEAQGAWKLQLQVVKQNYGNVVYSFFALYQKLYDWNKIYSGTIPVPEEYVGSICNNCANTGNAVYTFDTDEQGWILSSRVAWGALPQAVQHHPKQGNPPDPTSMTLDRITMNSNAGIPSASATFITSFDFDVVLSTFADGLANGRYVEAIVYFADGTTWISPQINTYGRFLASGIPLKEVADTTGGQWAVEIRTYSGGNNANGEVLFDNIDISVQQV